MYKEGTVQSIYVVKFNEYCNKHTRTQTTPPHGRNSLVNQVEFLGLITGLW